MSILKVSIRQVKAARALLAWSQSDLAKASGISEPTIKRLESDDGELGGRTETVERIRRTLEAAGIEFTNGGQPGVRMSSPIVVAVLAVTRHARKYSEIMGHDTNTRIEDKEAAESANRNEVESVCDAIEELAQASRTRDVRYPEYAALEQKLQSLAAFPPNLLVAVASAFGRADRLDAAPIDQGKRPEDLDASNDD